MWTAALRLGREVRRRRHFAASPGTLVEIERKKGWSVILSPSSRDVFLSQLDEALDKSHRLRPDHR
jgi:hypothetical protein